MAGTSIERKDILNFLANQPDEGWLEAFTTKDQIELWHKSRHLYSYIVTAWKAYDPKYPEDPAPVPPDEVVQDKKLKQLIVRLITPFIETYYALWQLTVYAYPKLKNQFPDEKSFPFQSDLELFKAMIMELVESDLLDCTLPYFKFSPRSMEPKLKDLSKFWEHGATFKRPKIKDLVSFVNRFIPGFINVFVDAIKNQKNQKFYWHLFLLTYAQQNQKEDPSLEKLYKAILPPVDKDTPIPKIFGALVTAVHHYSHVVEWVNGVIKQQRATADRSVTELNLGEKSA